MITINKELRFPPIDEVLINALDELFPERSADLTWDEKEVWFYAGRREVVRFLKQKYKEQTE